jgi:hypothetical protein
VFPINSNSFLRAITAGVSAAWFGGRPLKSA